MLTGARKRETLTVSLTSDATRPAEFSSSYYFVIVEWEDGGRRGGGGRGD